MRSTQLNNVLKFVIPTVFSQCAIFLFTIVDGIFVGHGVGTDALGAVNMALPFMMILSAVYMLTTIGGVTITAIRMGRKDIKGANQAFMHALSLTLLASAVFMIVGTIFNEALVSAWVLPVFIMIWYRNTFSRAASLPFLLLYLLFCKALVEMIMRPY